MSTDALRLLDEAEEITVRTRKRDGSTADTIIWSVVADGVPYVRSVHGTRGMWWRRADRERRLELLVDGEPVPFELRPVEDETVESAVDAEYLRKYAHDAANARPMVEPAARETTFELVR